MPALSGHPKARLRVLWLKKRVIRWPDGLLDPRVKRGWRYFSGPFNEVANGVFYVILSVAKDDARGGEQNALFISKKTRYVMT